MVSQEKVQISPLPKKIIKKFEKEIKTRYKWDTSRHLVAEAQSTAESDQAIRKKKNEKQAPPSCFWESAHFPMTPEVLDYY